MRQATSVVAIGAAALVFGLSGADARANGSVADASISVHHLHRFQNQVAFVVSWGAADPTAVTSFDVRVRSKAPTGDWTAWGPWLDETTDTSATYLGARGSTHCFAARAHGSEIWSRPRCTAVPYDDVDLIHEGGWTTAFNQPHHYLRTYAYSWSYGDSLHTWTIHARRLAVMADTCPDCGSVEIWWNGVERLASFSLVTPEVHHKVLFLAPPFASRRTGWASVVISQPGEPGGDPAPLIDGFGISQE